MPSTGYHKALNSCPPHSAAFWWAHFGVVCFRFLCKAKMWKEALNSENVVWQNLKQRTWQSNHPTIYLASVHGRGSCFPSPAVSGWNVELHTSDQSLTSHTPAYLESPVNLTRKQPKWVAYMKRTHKPHTKRPRLQVKPRTLQPELEIKSTNKAVPILSTYRTHVLPLISHVWHLNCRNGMM